MTDRERFVKCCLGEKVDRPPYWLMWGPWQTAWDRWKSEGCPFENYDQLRASLGAESVPMTIPVNVGPCPARGATILEEDDKQYTFIDSWGIKRRNFKGHESMSEFLDYPVKGRDDWEAYKAQWLDPEHPERLKGDWLKISKGWMDKGVPVQFGSFPDLTLFGGLRWLMGDEECLLAFYTQPDLVRDIMEHLTVIYLTVLRKVIDAGVRIDVVHIWEDMSGRQGSLISPAHFREFMTPRYARITELRRKAGIPLMSVDTDGNPDGIVPPMMEGGVNFLWPMEAAAGADPNLFRTKYPALALMGGFDKRAAAIGPKAIDAELERLRPAMESGRYIVDFDHLVPDDVSYENFCYYAQALKRMVGKP